jgi:hypothetical protein
MLAGASRGHVAGARPGAVFQPECVAAVRACAVPPAATRSVINGQLPATPDVGTRACDGSQHTIHKFAMLARGLQAVGERGGRHKPGQQT